MVKQEMAVITPFPTPELSGVPYTRYQLLDDDWDVLTVEHQYEDAGISTNTTGDIPVRTWELAWNGLTRTEAEIFTTHRALAEGRNNTFTFTDKEGNVHTGVRYKEFRCWHNEHRSWVKFVTATLVKYPA